MKRPLIILAGPTAVGKTALSVRLAKRINAEIISADSMQVYRYMDIGSAKIRPEEMDGVPHHLVDVLDPKEDFNVVRFQQMAKDAAREIWAKGRIPLVVGGTGFYIQALLYDIDFTENDGDIVYRQELEKIAREKGGEYLHTLLEAVDPQASTTIHPNNIKRMIRALEFHRQTGGKISEHNEKERAKESPYNYAYFVLTDERGRLYERIDKRVDLMLGEGLEDEVRFLREQGVKRGATAMQGLGYKEIYAYLEGECTLEEAVRVIKRDTRHFAKRQLTWFKREKDVIWADRSLLGGDDAIMDFMMGALKDKTII
mgnify:FL=1